MVDYCHDHAPTLIFPRKRVGQCHLQAVTVSAFDVMTHINVEFYLITNVTHTLLPTSIGRHDR